MYLLRMKMITIITSKPAITAPATPPTTAPVLLGVLDTSIKKMFTTLFNVLTFVTYHIEHLDSFIIRSRIK